MTRKNYLKQIIGKKFPAIQYLQYKASNNDLKMIEQLKNRLKLSDNDVIKRALLYLYTDEFFKKPKS